MREEFGGGRPSRRVSPNAQPHERRRALVGHQGEGVGRHVGLDLLVDLRRVAAFRVGELLRDHLERAHAERVDVHLFVVGLVVQLRRHELGRAQHATSLARRVVGGSSCGQAQVADPQIPGSAVDEDVVALDVAVDDLGVPRVQVRESFQNLPHPPLDDLPPHDLHPLNEALERARGQDLGDKAHFPPIAVHPGPVKIDDVLVIQPVQQPHFVDHARLLVRRHVLEVDDVPGDLDALDAIVRAPDLLVAALAD